MTNDTRFILPVFSEYMSPDPVSAKLQLQAMALSSEGAQRDIYAGALSRAEAARPSEEARERLLHASYRIGA